MHDLAPVVIVITEEDSGRTLAEALSAGRPMVLAARGLGSRPPAGAPPIAALLRHPFPITGVLTGRLEGPAAAIMLACDALYVTPRAALRLIPSGRGEGALLALRLGHAGARRVWFSGGLLPAREAVRAGWAEMASGTFETALQTARTRYEGLSGEALTLLRPLLYHQAGLNLAQARDLERAAFALAFGSGAPAEGIAAFLEKRKPTF